MAGRSSGSTTRRMVVAGARAERERSLVEALVDLAQGGDAGAHADRHVAEHEAHDEDEAGAGDLDRRHVEGQDVGHADDRAGDGEAQQRAELERRAGRRSAAASADRP